MTDPALEKDYVFALNGDWIGFRIGRFIFDTECNWVAWLPYDPIAVFAVNGRFVGHLGPGGRLFMPRRMDRRIPAPPPRPPRPVRPPRPKHHPPITGPAGSAEATLPTP